MLLLSTTLRLTCLLVCLLAIVNQCSSKEASSNKSSVPENSLLESATLNATNQINPIETSSSTSETNDSSIDDEDEEDKEEPKTEPKTIEKKNSKEEDNEDDEDEEGDETCDASCGGKMSEFIREYNFSQTFLPDDHEQLTETLLSSTDIYNQIHHVNDSLEVMQRFVKYVDKLSNNQDIIETMMYAFSMMMDKIYEVKLEPQCQADILQVVNGVRRRELWAMRFPDSFGKLPSGLLRGTVSSFGEYDQCISIKSPITPQLDRHIYGQYCQIQLRMFTPKIADYDPSFEDSIRAHPLWEQLMALGEVLGAQNFLTNKDMKIVKSLSQGLNALTNNMFYYGACFPSSCSAEDIERLYNRFVYPILKTPVSVLPKFCDKNPEIVVKVLDNYQWTAIICLSTLSIIVILCSLYHFYLKNFVDNAPKEPPTSKLNLIELYNNNNNNLNLNPKHEITQIDNPIPKSPKRSIPQQFVLSFSAFQNTDKLMAFDNRSGVVDSIRLVLTFFVYALQAFDFTFIMTTQLIKDIFFAGPGEFLSHNAYWFSRLPGIWIDGFMFTMGMMLINTQFSKLKRSNGQFDYLLYVWKRWYRLSIAMIGTFFALYLLPLFGNGPLWYIHDQWILPACKEPSSIISSFLYFSNTNAMRGGYKVEGTIPLCNPPTWFLSMSTQLYLIAPLVFLPLYFKPRIGITITVIIILLSPISTTAPYLFFNLPSYVSVTSFESAQEGVRAFLHYHTYPFQYVTALHIGFLTGYAIKRHPNMQFIGGRATELALWVMTFPLIVAIFVWHNSFWDFDKINSIYNTLGWFVCSKFMLPGALGYICYMCCTGRAKTMNRILTFRTLQPLAKLSYGIYLLRVPTIFYRIASPKHTYEIKYFQMWQNVFVDFLITAVMAYFLYLLFEAPAANIMRIFEQNDLRIGFNGQNKPKSDAQNNNKTKNQNQNQNNQNNHQEQVEMSNGKEKPNQFSSISLSVEQ